jgi:hypothetical protein
MIGDKADGLHEICRQCGRFLEVKNRPRANPVGGLGGGDRDAMATSDARYGRDDRALVLHYQMFTV